MPTYDRRRPGKQGRADASGALCAGVPDAKQVDVAKLAPEVLRHDLRRDVLQVDAVVALDAPRDFLSELGEEDDAAARLPRFGVEEARDGGYTRQVEHWCGS